MGKTNGLGAYFALAFSISWGGVLLVSLATGFPATRGGSAMTALAFLAMIAGPSLASLIVTAAVDGRAGLRDLRAHLKHWRVGPHWYAALLIAPVSLVLVLGALSLTSLAYVPAILADGDKLAILGVALIGGLGAGIFEELGWTGFVTPRLLEGRSVLAASMLFGVIWALWHFVSDYWGGGLRYGALWPWHALEWVVALAGFRTVMVWVYENTHSLSLGMLMHVSFTGSQMLLWPRSASPLQELVWYGIFALSLWVVVALVVRARAAQTRAPQATAAHADSRV